MSKQQKHHGAIGIEDPILEIRDATVTFDMARGSSRVLDNLNLDIAREEVIGIVGESGSGKSMFASAILDSVDDPGYLQGEVTYHPEDREPIDVLSLDEAGLKEVRWEDIAFVVQGAQSGFNPTMKIKDHFVETLRTHGADIEEGMERSRQLLEDVYLEPDQILESYAHQLSGGQKQRALVALGLVLQPDVVVMDEPTSALDLLMQRSIVSLLADLQEEYSLTIVFITHDLALVTDLADRIAVMYGFEVVEVGPSDQILSDSGHPYTRKLLNTVPTITEGEADLDVIEGSAPDPVNVPSGCTFFPRCPLADEQCEQVDPPLDQVGADHHAACHYPDEAREALPLTHRGDGV
jgi:oligopeptide/dipeptide ABC transporter ATP-binding protein